MKNKEKLLIKCPNTIYANRIELLLSEQGVIYRKHDENQDGRPDSYGPIEGISIFVFEQDLSKAKDIISSLRTNPTKSIVWCPKCGSEDIQYLAIRKESSLSAIINILLILIAGCYFCLPKELIPKTQHWLNITMLIVLISAIIYPFLHVRPKNCKCKKCGHSFHRSL